MEQGPGLQNSTGNKCVPGWPSNGNLFELLPTGIMICGHLIMRNWTRASNSFHMTHSGIQDRNKFESMQSKGENLHITGIVKSKASWYLELF